MNIASQAPADGSAGPIRDCRTAPRFSVTDLAVTRELDLSRIFAHLLDPCGSHAQGVTFLSLLLEELRPAPSGVPLGPGAGTRSRVTTEQPTGPIKMSDGETCSGSIDILVELEDGQRIAIENKPWAWEQPEQIERYLHYLARGDSPTTRDGVLLYWIGWSGEGADPDLSRLPDSLADRYVKMPYRKTAEHPSVEGWLRSCRDACKAPRVRSFLEDLLCYIIRTFPDVASLLYDHAQTLGKELGKEAEKRRGGWLFKQDGWTRSWPGVWIERRNQSALSFEVGASGWGDDNIRKRLLTAGEEFVGRSPLPPDAWKPHSHNTDPNKGHVSWTFDSEKVFSTDDREKGVKEIMALVETLLEAAAPG